MAILKKLTKLRLLKKKGKYNVLKCYLNHAFHSECARVLKEGSSKYLVLNLGVWRRFISEERRDRTGIYNLMMFDKYANRVESKIVSKYWSD